MSDDRLTGITWNHSYDGRQWALAIDAAAPVSSYRPDLLARHDAAPPETWEDILALARRGLVVVPAIPVDTLCNFYMLCIALGEEPFAEPDRVISGEVGAAALENLRDLIMLCQSGLYFVSGGQPGHRSAWLDPDVNRQSNNYFADTLRTLDEAWLRPRHPGYIRFQEAASLAVFRYITEGGDARATSAELDRLYAAAATGAKE